MIEIDALSSFCSNPYSLKIVSSRTYTADQCQIDTSSVLNNIRQTIKSVSDWEKKNLARSGLFVFSLFVCVTIACALIVVLFDKRVTKSLNGWLVNLPYNRRRFRRTQDDDMRIFVATTYCRSLLAVTRFDLWKVTWQSELSVLWFQGCFLAIKLVFGWLHS